MQSIIQIGKNSFYNIQFRKVNLFTLTVRDPHEGSKEIISIFSCDNFNLTRGVILMSTK